MKMTSADQTTFAGETINYELYPLVTGDERLAVFERIRGFVHS